MGLAVAAVSGLAAGDFERWNMWDRKSYVFYETLKNGTHVTVRAARADDGPKIRRAFVNLEPQTMYTRFFGYKPEITDQELKRVTEADFLYDVALVATIGTGDEEVVIGGASYSAAHTQSPPSTAEIAFTVEEDCQNLGIAGVLLRHIIGIARQNKLTQLTAEILAANAPMLTVVRRCGLKAETRSTAGVVHVTLDLAG
jgi:GNAT superfamily N-acetyltransferase